MKAYVDDMVIKSMDETDMIEDIQETFERLRKINMKLNTKKCSFGMEKGKFLGFLSKSAEKSLPFFKTLKVCLEKKDFTWTKEADKAFEEMKKYIEKLPTLVAPKAGESLIVYLVAFQECISAVPMAERGKDQRPIYFVSRVLQEAELNYPMMEKLVLALIHAARHFLAETKEEDKEADFQEQNEKKSSGWKLYTDESLSMEGSRADLMVVSPKGTEFTCALKFEVTATNNKVEYEAIIAGLRIAKEIKIEEITIF
ncbi:reverse transcriptase domain-containing protein, partial [Tanacetum coccineum]